MYRNIDSDNNTMEVCGIFQASSLLHIGKCYTFFMKTNMTIFLQIHFFQSAYKFR